MKTIFLVDKKNSALYTAAYSRAKLVNAMILCADEFNSPRKLITKIYLEKPDIVIFSWRRALLDFSAFVRSNQILKELQMNSNILVLIPDYIGLEVRYSANEKKIINMSHQYFVTNKDLFKKYSNTYKLNPPSGILHDLPNYDLINEINRNFKKRNDEYLRAIWVGNSKWGDRQGFYDHKRYKEVVGPLARIIKEHACRIHLDIIDSSKQLVDQKSTLKRIKNSDVLLMTSKTEGTALPILEALGLGTTVLTTNVGIAEEVIKTRYLLDSPTPEDIHKKLHAFTKNEGESDLKKLYNSYIIKAISEKIEIKISNQPTIAKPMNSFMRLQISLYWLVRFTLHLSKKYKFIK